MGALQALTLLGSLSFSAASCRNGPRQEVAKTLVDELFLGSDPMVVFHEEKFIANNLITQVKPADVDLALAVAPKPLTFWLELGAFEGGSAILATEQILKHRLNTSVITVDTFLGDHGSLWIRNPEERRWYLRPDGTISLFDRFRTNIRRAGLQSCILPIQATSTVALNMLHSMAEKQIIPLPQVIYLDAAHEEGEVLLELRMTWRALAPGGVVFGDDWLFPVGAHRDIIRFATEMKDELDDDWGLKVRHIRVLGRVRPGLFVSYRSFQWFMKKLPHVPTAPTEDPRKTISPGYSCWSEGYQWPDCCHEKFGPGGNPKCWDVMFTFERCCRQ